MATKKPVNKSVRIRKTAPVESTIAKARQASSAKTTNSVLTRLKSQLALPFKKAGRLLSFFVPRYFINAWRELRQVMWPSAKDTRRLTLAVFIFAVVFGAIVAVVDKGLDEFFKKVVLK